MLHSLLKNFPAREEKLKSIYRYSMFEVFFYRSNLWDHAQRVALIVKEIGPLAYQLLPEFDVEKAFVLALVHDDAEMITGDVQLGHKQRMSAQELQQIDDEEARAIEQLVGQYPQEVADFSYEALLLQALHKDTIEAKVVSLADKLDAYCESMHEVLGGNISALRSLLMYEKILATFDQKFPELQPLLASKASPFINWQRRTHKDYVPRDIYQHVNRPHTVESIGIETDFSMYNRWRQLVMENVENGTELLTQQKYFLEF